jgi:pimeloyl-ACP methyl ester carboxylesterase
MARTRNHILTPPPIPAWRPGSPSPTDFESLPNGASVESLSFVSEDGARSKGFLYTLGGERTVLCVTHPRADLTRHYMIPSLLEAGYAVCGLLHRSLTTDYALTHELMLLDIAACLKTLKEEKGFQQIVLLANSGGGGIFGLYQWQAEARPPGRFGQTPAGEGPDLNAFALTAADGLILLATPFGEPSVIMRSIDPSVIDETDPFSCDPDLDMYNPRNGYREPPESSTYTDEFARRYRAAQRARIARIDAYARSSIAEQEYYREQMRDSGFMRLPSYQKSYIKRRAMDTKPVVVFRGEASLSYCDLSMYPSKRVVGNFGAFDTEAMNNVRRSPGWLRTPRAWLSNSSGITSRSSLRLALGNITIPTVIINYTADRGVYPKDVEEMLELSGANDKELHHVDGEHYGLPIEGVRESNPRATAGRILARWLSNRFAGPQEAAL